MIFYLNLSSCYINMKEYKSAICACNEAILIDDKNFKAYFRRAKARADNIVSGNSYFFIDVTELVLASNDLRIAISLSNNNH